ncbi:hypothetical protein Tco_0302597 [Tanacetum coccineum]
MSTICCEFIGLIKSDIVGPQISPSYDKAQMQNHINVNYVALSSKTQKLDVMNTKLWPTLPVVISNPQHPIFDHDNATYSAYADDIVVQSCFFDIKLINLSPRSCIPLEVLLRVSRHPAWSASKKAISSNPESFGY